jgi:hypothetical protein
MPIAKTICIIALAAATFVGCKPYREVTKEQTFALRDTLFKILPGTLAADVNVTDQKELSVVLTNATLYAADESARHAAAIAVAEMAMEKFTPDNGIKAGKLVLTKIVPQTQWTTTPPDALTINVNIDSLLTNDDHLLQKLGTLHR